MQRNMEKAIPRRSGMGSLTWNDAEIMASARSYWRHAAVQCTGGTN